MSAKKKAAKRVVRRQVSVQTTKQIGGKGAPTSHVNETEFTGDLPEHPGMIDVGGGVTKSTGEPFEFVRVDIRVSVPCAPTDEGYRNAASKASDLVEELIQAELDRAFGE